MTFETKKLTGLFMLDLISGLMMLAATGTLLMSCAKERPVDRVDDTDENRFEKSILSTEKPWIFRSSIVATSARPTLGFIGQQSKDRAGFFDFSREHLRFLGASQPEKKDHDVPVILNQWPVSHSEYKRQESGGRVTNIEVEDTAQRWEDKSHFKINWAAPVISDSTDFPGFNKNPCWLRKSARIKEDSTTVSREYIGYVLIVDYELDNDCLNGPRYLEGIQTQTLHFRHSFVPLPDDGYQVYQYTGEDDPLNRKYGFFQTVTANHDTNGYGTRNTFYMNRWHPEKTHTYYFAKDYPEKYKWIFRDPEKGIIPLTNKLFGNHELKIRFEVKDYDPEKRFGDSRYSFIRLVEDPLAYGPLGYGPTSVNPFTGQIYSGTMVVWIQNLPWYIKLVREELKNTKEQHENSPVFTRMKSYLGSEPETWTSGAATLKADTTAGKYFDLFLPDYTFNSAGSMFAHAGFSSETPAESGVSLPAFRSEDSVKALTGPHEPESDGWSLLPETEELMRQALEKNSPADFQPYNSTIYEMEYAMADIRSMALDGLSDEQIIEKLLYRTALHEFGHQLGLRHNFYGSFDEKNFRLPLKDQHGHTVPQATSSVMDYVAFSSDVTFHHGFEPYDEAALLYAYSNGKVDRSVQDNKHFLFCTDQHVFTNPLCNRFDRGTSPTGVTLSLIEDYDARYHTRNFRFDRAYWNAGSYPYQIFELMLGLKSLVKLDQEAFGRDDLNIKISAVEKLSTPDINNIADTITSEVRRAILIAAAFFSSVMEQSISQRSYLNQFDPYTGALKRKGIFEDKFFAGRMLLGDDGIPFDPNRGVTQTSLLVYLNDAFIGPVLNQIVHDRVRDPGPIYTGYDSVFRAFFGLNAAFWRDNGGTSTPLSQLRVACFTPSTFATRFNIPDIYSFSQNGEAAHPVVLENLDLSRLNASADDYFRSGSTFASVIKLNSNFYVSSREFNPVAYDLMLKGDARNVLLFYQMHSQLTEGRIASCQ